MQMMYETVYKALQEAGLDNEYEPQDYLNFFCLGNREAPESDNRNISNGINPSLANTPQPQVQAIFNVSTTLFIYMYQALDQVHVCSFCDGNLGTHTKEPAIHDIRSLERNDCR